MSDDKKTGFDADIFAQNMQKVYTETGKTLGTWLTSEQKPSQDVSQMTKTIGKVAEYWLSDKDRAMQVQASLFTSYMNLWQNTAKAFAGEVVEPLVKPDVRDARFKSEEWSSHPLYDFLKQFYLITSDFAEDLVERADIDADTKHRAEFYTKQITAALSPSNFIATNPEVIKKTIETNGESLVKGLSMLAEDIERGGGKLRLRLTDENAFKVGENLATTKGSVIFRNDLIELIQYQPLTESVSKIPLLIVPPWINKFYILDLTPEKSFIKWAVEQGLTVFVVSWVNPDARHGLKTFEDYMNEGILAALTKVLEITDVKQAHTIGYCVGGTLLASTMGYMAAKKDKRILSATFFTTQVDFTHAGDLGVFVDEEQIQAVEKSMEGKGYLEGSSMASAFNMLRANDLIWAPAISHYLKGNAPSAFDLLFWNSDSTRMPAKNHSFYLRQCYQMNHLSQGLMELAGIKIDLSKVKTPIYNLAAREDHIAPAKSAFLGMKYFGGDMTYVMGGSGHIAGVVNPPSKGKYQFWADGDLTGSFENWVATATETKGSWWGHWREWVRSHDKLEVSPREVTGEIVAAPGDYVRVRC